MSPRRALTPTFLIVVVAGLLMQVGVVQSINFPHSTTPWGDPNLQGLWDFRTIFPLERSDDLIGKTELPQEEAAEFHRE